MEQKDKGGKKKGKRQSVSVKLVLMGGKGILMSFGPGKG